MSRTARVTPLVTICLASLLSAASAPCSAIAEPESDSVMVLEHARNAMGFAAGRGRVLHVHAATAVQQPYQSDRTYPPFFSMIGVQEIWFDVDTGGQRIHQTDMFPGIGPNPPRVTIDDGVNAAAVRGDNLPVHRRQAESRNLDPWAVITDWSRDPDVRRGGVDSYRDYPRIALVRRTANGEERLLIDPKSGFPIKLDLVEPHYLWGQRHIEYVWSTWAAKDGLSYPGATCRASAFSGRPITYRRLTRPPSTPKRSSPRRDARESSPNALPRNTCPSRIGTTCSRPKRERWGMMIDSRPSQPGCFIDGDALLAHCQFTKSVTAFGQYPGLVHNLLLDVIDNEIHHRGQGLCVSAFPGNPTTAL